ncbi:MAG TPA: hypothetical protein PK725_01195 [Rhodocyclaceae bacterium]|nr:hypothetical protein [Rhodocyclaceae bacterium]
MELGIAIIAVLVVAIAIAAFRRTDNDSGGESNDRIAAPDSGATHSDSPAESDMTYVEELNCELTPAARELWRTLLNMSFGNRMRARDYVFAEKAKDPHAPMETLIASVIEAWRREINR